jgi:hypothetical protein
VLQLRSKFASEIHINVSYLNIIIFRNTDFLGELESIGKDDDKQFCCVGCTALRAYRNLWLRGLSVLKLRDIMWKNDASVLTHIVLYSLKRVHEVWFSVLQW